jgi:hypothetical protein
MMSDKPCKCGARIEFMKMESGAAMPYNPETAEKRLVRFNRAGQSYGKMVTTYLPHFADCPDAEDFKKEST